MEWREPRSSQSSFDPVGIVTKETISLVCNEGQFFPVVGCVRPPQLMDNGHSLLLDQIVRTAQPDLDECT
ncbi:hypothetical protein SAMN05444679_13450 [Variovorax sp. CF079]|nr:hypothetical protein SAMN05444679_13450 [Variovorax sp. CF079]